MDEYNRPIYGDVLGVQGNPAEDQVSLFSFFSLSFRFLFPFVFDGSFPLFASILVRAPYR